MAVVYALVDPITSSVSYRHQCGAKVTALNPAKPGAKIVFVANSATTSTPVATYAYCVATYGSGWAWGATVTGGYYGEPLESTVECQYTCLQPITVP